MKYSFSFEYFALALLLSFSFSFSYSYSVLLSVAGYKDNAFTPAHNIGYMHTDLMYFSLLFELISISNVIIQYSLCWWYCSETVPVPYHVKPYDVSKQTNNSLMVESKVYGLYSAI